jgi:membrane protease subunit (stomatin/prohibitin family)
MRPAFTALGLELNQFIVENISLPEELQKVMDQRIGVNMAGDLSRYTQFEVAQSLPVAAANSGGVAGMGVGLGAGAAMAQTMMPSLATAPGTQASSTPARARFCIDCGRQLPDGAKFCPGCGREQ